jgi:nucleotide-binding universal stress UspA family protein
MSVTFLVGVDGSEGAQRAAAFAAERARNEGARLLLVCVVEWSPFDTLTPDEQAGRHVEREKEIAHAEAEVLKPIRESLGKGLEVESLVRHGHVAEVLCELAQERGVAQIFSGRLGRGRFKSLLFGSVAGSLVQVSPVPVTVVP